MEVIPSIDLRGGRVVRLQKGDPDRESVFSTDPVAAAKGFFDAGAPRIHIVDLDGALQGQPAHLSVIQDIVKAVPLPVQVGGGLRTSELVDAVLGVGVERIVLGTAALHDPSLVQRAVATHGPERVIVGLDAREGLVAVNGWQEDTTVSAKELMTSMTELGVGRFIFTDIARDGMMTSPNFDSVASLVQKGRELVVSGSWGDRLLILASGGIADMDHLHHLAALGVEGAILGSALYRGGIDLTTAIQALLGR